MDDGRGINVSVLPTDVSAFAATTHKYALLVVIVRTDEGGQLLCVWYMDEKRPIVEAGTCPKHWRCFSHVRPWKSRTK